MKNTWPGGHSCSLANYFTTINATKRQATFLWNAWSLQEKQATWTSVRRPHYISAGSMMMPATTSAHWTILNNTKNYADSLLNGGNIRQIRAAEAKYENEKKQAEIDLLAEKQKLSEAKREKDKLYLYVAIAGIVGLAGLIVLLFRNNRSKQKTNRELAAYNQEVKYQKDLVEGK